jgi:hypothetical protein
MSDDCDRADIYIESVIDDHVRLAMRRALEIPPGNPGECCACGEYSMRLVNDHCARCRDKFGLD